MKKIILIFVLVILAVVSVWLFAAFFRPKSGGGNFQNKKSMEISSPVFKNQENIPAKYTCDGSNISPPLEISGVPQGVKSLALIVDDPDVPSGVWTHWTVWNIDPATEKIEEGGVPVGSRQGKNSGGHENYDGPCPPSGTHRYFFKLYALDAELNLPAGASISEAQNAVSEHTRDQVSLIGLYGRK